MENIKVQNMMCESCVKKISEALKNNNIEANVILRLKIVQVDPKDLELAKKIIKELGYEVI